MAVVCATTVLLTPGTATAQVTLPADPLSVWLEVRPGSVRVGAEITTPPSPARPPRRSKLPMEPSDTPVGPPKPSTPAQPTDPGKKTDRGTGHAAKKDKGTERESAPEAAAGGDAPRDDTALEAVRARLETLYHEAGLATDAYNAAEERADKQSAALHRLNRRIAAGQRRLDFLKDRAGAAVRAQYRGGGLPPTARLMLSDDPRQFLDGADRVRQGQHGTRGLLHELADTQRELKKYAGEAAARWKKLEADRKKKAAAKKRITQRIETAEALESQLEKEERERLRQLERQAGDKQQAEWLRSGALDSLTAEATRQGRAAVEFATEQLGKPYQWGAEGPATFDCSGLTSQAWAAAGQPIPRTSQEQWRLLRHVDPAAMRPGDLIIYHDDASHVGMYIGKGLIIHAPRPGRTVTVTGAGSMRILGVVRPDQERDRE
ncbi:NlpC/P60 family protein [Streptomyces sp. NPDC058045]|uniref:C40 family peptidase n=1 Tax=Streptomyces sp. NPDC058045 TaxID=3346311 RepID=UPI0036E130A5